MIARTYSFPRSIQGCVVISFESNEAKWKGLAIENFTLLHVQMYESRFDEDKAGEFPFDQLINFLRAYLIHLVLKSGREGLPHTLRA